jgi:hypothetical protein
MTARIHLDTTSVTVGKQIAGVLIVTNPGATIHRPHQCRPVFSVFLTNAAIRSDGAVSDLMCHGRPLTLAHGANRLPFTVSPDYQGCFQPPGGPPSASDPPCLAGLSYRPLPAGTYKAEFFNDNPPFLPKPQSITIHLRS